MIRVFLADDHPIVREGLKQILSETPDVALVGEADNGLDVLNKATKEKWDILLLDLSLPGKQGIDVLKELQKSSPDLRVLVLSVHPESEYAFRVLKAGAAGYLVKTAFLKC
jgi:DNA-binding NarL/FixJ family response regulator